jgi:predicted small lipoprotein YifL
MTKELPYLVSRVVASIARDAPRDDARDASRDTRCGNGFSMKRWEFLCILLVGILGGCGTVGPPIPPEDTAIAVKLQKAKEKEKEKAAKAERKPEEVAPVQDEVPLPSTRPIGTR